MRFSPSFLDQIRARVNISTVVGRRVQWDRRKTNAGKGNYWACCPFHTEKSPSFHVEDRKGRYHCFGCKASGDIFTFLVEKDGTPFPEAVEKLAAEAGLPLPVVSEADAKREEKRASLYDIMEMAQKLFVAELQTGRGAKARGYLADRDLSPAIQSEFGLGYAPDDRGWLRSELAAKGILLEDMVEAGLVVTGDDIPVAYDRFRDRVMFPIRDGRGRVIAFGGRALRSDVPAKYLNSPETPIFHKGEVLYNFDKARALAHASSQLIAVEGYVDVIALHRSGLPHCVAPLGTALTEAQLGMLWKAVPEPILCFDGDGAGLKAAYRALDLAIPLLQPGHSLKFAFLPEGQDPDDLLRQQGAAAVREVIAAAEPLADVVWRRALAANDRATPERKASFEKELRSLLGAIGDETVRRHYLDDLRGRLTQLFQSAPRGSRPPNAQRMFARGGRRPDAWQVALPASPSLKAAARAPEAASSRRPQMILLCLVNHPELLHEFWDEFAAADLRERPLEALRAALLDCASSSETLAGSVVRASLGEKGFASDLARLDALARRLNEWHLEGAAGTADARTALRQMFTLQHKTVVLERELRHAELAFAQDPTDANLSAIVAVREQLQSATGAEVTVAGFGAASGRGETGE